MSSTPDDSQSRLGFVTDDDAITFEIDEAIYPLEAVYGAGYLFVDRCFVFLQRAREQVVSVRLTSRTPPVRGELDGLAGEFVNELLSQTTRLRLTAATSKIRDYYTAAALRAATSAPSIDDLLAELEAEELAEDPLEILVPWEEKADAAGKGDEPGDE